MRDVVQKRGFDCGLSLSFVLSFAILREAWVRCPLALPCLSDRAIAFGHPPVEAGVRTAKGGPRWGDREDARYCDAACAAPPTPAPGARARAGLPLAGRDAHYWGGLCDRRGLPRKVREGTLTRATQRRGMSPRPRPSPDAGEGKEARPCVAA